MQIVKSNKKDRIYLADLTHTKNGIMALTFPLGTSYVATYAKQNLGDSFDFELFKFPETLAKQITKKPPRVLALSNYSWNLELGYNLCLWAKNLYPDLIIIMGGPNFPTSEDEKLDFLSQRGVVDFYIENEGEVAFTALIEKLLEYDFNVDELKSKNEIISHCSYIVKNKSTKSIKIVSGGINRIRDVNAIDSPYLSGMLDKFFKYSLTPMIETHRGCPFSCTYCADGLRSKNKVTSFGLDRVEKELYYIANNIKNIDEMYITDLNFGMFKKDIETAKIIAKVQSDLNWPTTIFATTGKNKTERVIETAKILKGSWITGPAIQSSDSSVLKNVKRGNISSDSYKQISEFMKSLDREALTFTELILGLPGDTKKKHFESLRYAIDSKMTKLKIFQAMLLVGTDMATPRTRDTFGLVGKFRITAGGVGVYNFDKEKIPIAEIHEVIVASNDMTFEEHISCRVMGLLLEAYHNQSQFEEIFSSLSKMNISEFDFLVYLHKNKNLYTKKIKKIIKNYESAIRDNLYDTHEEAAAVATNPDNIKKYESGELGFNELLICNSDMYFAMEDTASILLKVLEKYLKENGIYDTHVMEYFNQLTRFTLCKKREINNSSHIIKEYFDYDFQKISEINYEVDPRTVKKSSSSILYKFYHSDGQKYLIKNSVDLYTNHTDGISRMLYSNNLQKLYRNFKKVTLKNKSTLRKDKTSKRESHDMCFDNRNNGNGRVSSGRLPSK